MEVLSRPWNGLIMATLETHGPQRYSELRGRLDAMGDRMLSARLKELEQRGLVLRRVQEGPPVRVAYELSDVGRGFRDVAMALSGWGRGIATPPKRARRGGKERSRPGA